jgi:hypothetical protein
VWGQPPRVRDTARRPHAPRATRHIRLADLEDGLLEQHCGGHVALARVGLGDDFDRTQVARAPAASEPYCAKAARSDRLDERVPATPPIRNARCVRVCALPQQLGHTRVEPHHVRVCSGVTRRAAGHALDPPCGLYSLIEADALGGLCVAGGAHGFCSESRSQ